MKQFAIAAALFVAAATPALAEDGNWLVGRDQVHIVDRTLDTRTAAGRAALLARVNYVARQLCGSVKPRVRFDACVADTVQRTARDTAATRSGQGLALAIREGSEVRLAAR